MSRSLVFTLAIAAASGVVVHLSAQVMAIGRLKRHYPFEWSRIGEPTPFGSLTSDQARDFLDSPESRDLRDPKLTMLIGIRRKALTIAFALYVVGVVTNLIARYV